MHLRAVLVARNRPLAVEGDDKIAVLLGAERSVQSVAEHRVAHSGGAAAALFHEVHRRKGLGKHGIARARTIVAAMEFCQRQGRWWITRAGHDNSVGRDLKGDFAAEHINQPLRPMHDSRADLIG